MRWLAGGNFKSACKIDLVSQMPHAQQYADARIAKFNIVLEKIVTVCNNGVLSPSYPIQHLNSLHSSNILECLHTTTAAKK